MGRGHCHGNSSLFIDVLSTHLLTWLGGPALLLCCPQALGGEEAGWGWGLAEDL
jgi:hypothetical protein